MVQKDFKLVQRVDFIKEICRGRKVLHLGCTNYPYTGDAIANEMLLHFELEKTASEVVGFDLDPRGLEILRSKGSSNLFVADLEQLEKVSVEDTFDVIIGGEMIEHLFAV